ncbi:hypothetical protein ACFLSE_06875 [Bacteroidota bacterium]
MKKLIYILLAFIVGFSACDPNEELYDELDEIKPPYSASIDYLFTADDYETASGFAIMDAITDDDTTNAENIEDMEAFNMYFTAEDYVGKVLGELFPEYNLKSTANVTYNNFIGGLDYLDNFETATSYELVTADYDAMGEDYGDPGYYDNFSSSIDIEDYIPDWLLIKYPSAVANDIVKITYAYYSGSLEDRDAYFSFDGTEWELSDAYVLTSADYDSMGAPGAYDNFSSSVPPGDYLPAFLLNKYIYAQSGDSKVVVYQYYSGGVSTKAKEYRFDGSVWTEYDAIETVTNQFVHNGEAWFFDPTITVVMGSTDYQAIVDYVNVTFGAEYINSYGTAEFIYGADAYYGNFDGADWDQTMFADWAEALEKAVSEALLPSLFPTATILVNGVDMYYQVIYATYNSGTSGTWLVKYKVKTESPLEFELVEGPTAQ